MSSDSTSRVRLGRVLLAVAVAGLVATGAGCLAASQSRLVRVELAPPPALASAGAGQSPRAGHGGLGGSGRAKFQAAREAFWSYDTETAVRLLRELHAEDALEAEHFHWLALQCYEQSDRWAESVALLTELGLDEEQPAWLAFARFRAGLPGRQFQFAAEAAPIPFALHRDDLMVVEARINGAPARLLVDTGASVSWLTESLARKSGVDRLSQTIALNDANDTASDTPLGLVRELAIGGVTVRDTPALIGRSLLLRFSTPVDGILGWDILQQIDLEIDFPARRITLREPRGPLAAAPSLGGRSGPVLELRSAGGRPLHVFYDTGMHSGRACIDLFTAESGPAPRELGAGFNRAWRPTISMGMHSVSLAWPRLAEPFTFWLAGHRFEVPAAALYRRVQLHERLIHLDGMVGNAPFLEGKLRLCGVKRRVEFELCPPATLVATASESP